MIHHADYHPPLHQGLNILYVDNDLVIVDKPAGLLSVPGKGIHKQDCMLSRMKTEFPDALVVHRLDMPTSGIIIFALNTTSQKQMGLLFEKKMIHKTYIARVFGTPGVKQGQIDLPLMTDWPNRPKQKIDFKLGKSALTKYSVLIDDDTSSLLELTPVTGRSHQLRVHMSALGHPILGDALYGINESMQASERLLLHAHNIRFKHPVTERQIDITSNAEFK